MQLDQNWSTVLEHSSVCLSYKLTNFIQSRPNSPDCKVSKVTKGYVFLSCVGVALSSVVVELAVGAGGILCRGNCSQGEDRSNLRNSCVISRGSHTTRFTSSSYLTCENHAVQDSCDAVCENLHHVTIMQCASPHPPTHAHNSWIPTVLQKGQPLCKGHFKCTIN